jgi:hypothetical protein
MGHLIEDDGVDQRKSSRSLIHDREQRAQIRRQRGEFELDRGLQSSLKPSHVVIVCGLLHQPLNLVVCHWYLPIHIGMIPSGGIDRGSSQGGPMNQRPS